ncbi:hypothetical protein JHJ32_02320 [Parapedobacter sp. ISTM3]|jgi:hypothetical protein|uniref:Uncharacterized protein n=1 Tax=Parapedobacter luteus TaxID=623280 RepID=A0A1T4ZZ05_9SPHI|nr:MULTISPECIES: hypothetical protein [Parapedobacter]MBK1438810.1 hypothetical protein [Parapedobacter sp. ISTM3]SKB27960.1 hypothetical protein SAMN05660226_00314 [Parapedobacter luteus]
MKHTKKHYHALIEHYLVPAALFLLNINLIHIIYAYFNGSWDRLWHLVALTIAFAALGSAVLLKNQRLLWCSMGYYLLLLAYS